MHERASTFLRLCLFATAALIAAAVAIPGRSDAQSIPAYVLDDDVVLRPDFSTIETVRVERRVRTDADIGPLGIMTVPFRNDIDRVDILEAFTLKRDGRIVKVQPDGIQLQTLGVPGLPPSALGFSDLRQSVVIFPDLEPGDRTVLLARITGGAPSLPGGYVGRFTVPAGIGGAEGRVTLHLPPGQTLKAGTEGFVEDQAPEDGARTWHYQAAGRHGAAVVLTSTWPDEEAMAASMAPGFLNAMTVTPDLQALADRLTRDTSDPTEQVRRIYEWVSREIRYVNIMLGLGGVVPHAAEAVLRAGYGDCKDHSVLFATLLKAKGIAAWPVLIGLENQGYVLTTPPSLFGLDHAIVEVPALGVWADTTLARLPFGTLHFSEYGKPVLLMTPDAPRMSRTPLLAPGAARHDVRTEAVLDPDGVITGTTRIVATGPFVFDLRGFAAAAQGKKEVAHQRLRMLGYEGTGLYEAHNIEGFGDRFQLDGRFRLVPRPDRLTGTSFRLPPGLATTPRPGMLLLGSLPDADTADTAPIPCWSGEESETLSLRLPPGKRIRSLPSPLVLETTDLRYRATWSVTDDVVSVERRMVTHVRGTLCQGAARAEDQAALVKIREDYLSAQIALEDAPAQPVAPRGASAPAGTPPAPPSAATPASPSATAPATPALPASIPATPR